MTETEIQEIEKRVAAKLAEAIREEAKGCLMSSENPQQSPNYRMVFFVAHAMFDSLDRIVREKFGLPFESDLCAICGVKSGSKAKEFVLIEQGDKKIAAGFCLPCYVQMKTGVIQHYQGATLKTLTKEEFDKYPNR